MTGSRIAEINGFLLEIILTAMLTGVGTGVGVAIGTYFANKALIKNIEKLADVANRLKNGDKGS